MKKLFILSFMLASVLCSKAQSYDAKVQDDINFEDFTDNSQTNNGTSIEWDGYYIDNIHNNNGVSRSYNSKLSNLHRISVSNKNDWNIWYSTEKRRSYFQKQSAGEGHFYIHDLKVGDVVKIWLQGDCYIMSENTATNTVQSGDNAGDDIINQSGSPLSDGQELRVVNNMNDGIIDIKLTSIWAGIRYINIEVRHEASYTITPTSNYGNTFKFTGDGIFTDKHAAVPYLNVSFGNDNNLTYVKKINNDFGVRSKSESGNEYTEFSNNVPSQGTFYYFFPEISGTITVKGYRDNTNWAVFFSNLGKSEFTNMYEGNTNNFIEYSQRIEKGQAYYISSNAYTANSEHPVFQLTEYTFTPDFTGVYHGPLSFVTSHGATSVDDATQSAIGLKNVAVKACLGNIKNVSVEVKNNQLKFSSITYYTDNEYKENENVNLKTGKSANKGGAVLVYMNPKYTNGVVTEYDDIFVLTVPYTAEQYDDRETKQIKRWDFYSNSLTLGKSTDTGSQLYKEMHLGNGKSDWTETYLNLHKPTDENHVFKNAYDMVGDNADMIVETEGLIFHTAPNESCIFNELDPSSNSFRDRYVGIFNGGSFTIPRLESGDFIRIKMNRYGSSSNGKSQAILRITGATDIVGNAIGEDYAIGGSAPFATEPNTPNGEYNFISTGGDFTITVIDAALLKLYTIEIYKNSEFVSNNRVLGDGRSFLYVDDDQAVTRTMYLHYRGKGESIKCLEQTGHTGTYYDDVNHRGKDIVFPEDIIPEGGQRGYVTSLSVSPIPSVDFGSVRLKIGCMTMNGKYVTDYDYWGFTVGYRKTQPYPYTWDFTDLSSRVMSTDNGMSAEQQRNPDNRVWYDYSSEQTGNYHRIGYDGLDGKGGRFTQGGQLYAGNKMIQETEGLGMNMSNVSPMYNDGMRIANVGGLELNSNAGADWWRHRIEIPHVPADAVVYLRVKKLPADEVVSGHFYAGYSYGSWVRNTNTETAMPAANATEQQGKPKTLRIFDREVAESDEEYTYIIPGSAKSESENITIYLNGVILKKIAVSEDFKKIGKTGFATESRTRIIDHDLTAYFTGVPVKAYEGSCISNAQGKVVQVKLSPVRFMPAAPEEATAEGNIGRGCILYNNAEANANESIGKTVSAYNGGFHLFVPDMHDNATELGTNYKTCNTGTNVMKACVPTFGVTSGSSTLSATDGNDVRYILTATPHQEIGGSYQGVEGGDVKLVGFYKVDPQKGAKMHGNAAYLQISQNVSLSKVSIVFFDEIEDVNGGIATAIDESSLQDGQTVNENTQWYNLNGQKMNGMPSSSGIYIINGKKIVVK